MAAQPQGQHLEEGRERPGVAAQRASSTKNTGHATQLNLAGGSGPSLYAVTIPRYL